MKNIFASKVSIAVISTIAGLYLLFLILPFLLIPFLNSAANDVSAQIQKTLNIKTEFEKFRIITTPKLSAGVNLKGFRAYLPDNSELINANNISIKMSLIPLIFKKIELDTISADKININLAVKKDGHFLIEDIFTPKSQTKDKSVNNAESKTKSGSGKNNEILPFGLKLSNHLPDFKLKSYKLTFIDYDSSKKYVLEGVDTNVEDVIFNKQVKLKSKGSFTLDSFTAFNYDIKILNKIMPAFDINDLFVQNKTTPQAADNKKPSVRVNIIKIFNLIKNNQIKADLTSDIKTGNSKEGYEFSGFINADKISMLIDGKMLPESKIGIELNGDEFKIDSDLNSNTDEKTVLSGVIKSGRNPKINISCTSNATIDSLFKIVNTFLNTIGIDDLKTLDAKGQLDVNFNINSDFKKINSDGYLKLNNGLINWGLYNIKINNLIADIILDNNTVLINKAGFNTLGIPFNIQGTITPDAKADIKVSTTKLPVKELLVSLGQAAILRDNSVNSGTISINAQIKDELLNPKITGLVDIYNLNLKNKPADIILTLNPVNINLKTTESGYSGKITAQNINLSNPALNMSAQSIQADIDENKICFKKSPVYIGDNLVDIEGNISDYIKENIRLDFITSNNIQSVLKGYINPYKMNMNIDYNILNNANIIIPGFDKSKLSLTGSVNISGDMLNPVLQGQFTANEVNIPEIPANIKNLDIYLNGPILKGNMTADNFTSGGISADNLSGDLSLYNNVFYLSNLKGGAFEGNFESNIEYNLSDTACRVIFSGYNMNALKAIEGAAGIKNALSGVLSVDADISFKGIEYNDMINSMKGNAEFEVKNGVLANLGSLKMILGAQNIVQNSVLKNTTQNITSLPVIQKSSEFDYIKGNLTFDKGYANLNPVLTSGPSMAYYITGKFHILTGSVNAVVLGRLSEDVVSVLGSISDFAVDTITSLIPGLESVTTKLAKTMTISPDSVDTSKIPSLRDNTVKYKDFKVDFNGGANSSSSYKSFKWIAKASVDALEKEEAKKQQELIQESLKQNAKVIEDTAKEFYNQNKEQLNKLKDDADDLLKSLFSAPDSSN